MRIYYDEVAKNIVLGQANRLFATGSLEASEFRGRVSVIYKDTNFRELFLKHDRILKEDGSGAGQTIEEVLMYLNAEFNKSPFVEVQPSVQGIPTLLAENKTYTVPENEQVIFAKKITLQTGARIKAFGILVQA